jgi:hypothetical protein
MQDADPARREQAPEAEDITVRIIGRPGLPA